MCSFTFSKSLLRLSCKLLGKNATSATDMAAAAGGRFYGNGRRSSWRQLHGAVSDQRRPVTAAWRSARLWENWISGVDGRSWRSETWLPQSNRRQVLSNTCAIFIISCHSKDLTLLASTHYFLYFLVFFVIFFSIFQYILQQCFVAQIYMTLYLFIWQREGGHAKMSCGEWWSFTQGGVDIWSCIIKIVDVTFQQMKPVGART